MATIREVRAAARRAWALSDPTRLSVLLAIERHPRSLVDQIADEVGRDQSLVSRHCQRLHEAGVVTRLRKGHPLYQLTPYGQRLLERVMEEPPVHHESTF